jgi:hypothetical protein
MRAWIAIAAGSWIGLTQLSQGSEPDPAYHLGGELDGSLKSAQPLAIYDAHPEHLWNRLFAAFYTRTSNLPSRPGGKPVKRIEGGDYIDFLGWGNTAYWSAPETTKRLNGLLDEFLTSGGSRLITDPLRRAVFLRDLWAVHDFLTDQNIRRFGDLETRQRREQICGKLARVIESLTLPLKAIAALPDTYAAAVRSGVFPARQDFETSNDYLPRNLLTKPDEWVEIDFHQPPIHEDLYERFLTMHARIYRGRSYFRVFYRFPGGRSQLTDYLKRLHKTGVDWQQASEYGFILLKKDAPQIPIGTEVALVQFMMTLDDRLRPTPTKIVESVRHRTYRNTDGTAQPYTNTEVGMHVREYTFQRRLLFDNLRLGGLRREPDDRRLYRIIFQPDDARDWGTRGREPLFRQCVRCHMTPSAKRTGVHSIQSIVHMGGFGVGAQPGIAHALDPAKSGTQADRVRRWKTKHETYRRLLDRLGR